MSPNADAQNQAVIDNARRNGQLAVVAAVAIGPGAGSKVVSLTPRDDFMQLLTDARAMGRQQRRYMLRKAQDAIRKTLGKRNPTKEEDQNLMDDLVILQTLYLAAGTWDKGIADAGLAWIALDIDPDESRPWSERGMLDPAVVAELGVSDQPARNLK